MKRTLAILFFLVLGSLGGEPAPQPDRVALLEARLAVMEQQYGVIVDAHNNLADVVAYLADKLDKSNRVLGPGFEKYQARYDKSKSLDKSR